MWVYITPTDYSPTRYCSCPLDLSTETPLQLYKSNIYSQTRLDICLTWIYTVFTNY